MTKKVLLLATFLFPVLLFAQSSSDCERIFTKVEHLPSFKISNEAFEDTLAKVLTSKRFPLKDNEITYKFVVTNKSKIEGLTAISGSVRKEDILKETILKLADLWKPAKQNGYDVCAYVLLKLKFIDSKISIEILPPFELTNL